MRSSTSTTLAIKNDDDDGDDDDDDDDDDIPSSSSIWIYIYMAMSQNCVWNVPRCSGRVERRGFVTGLVPDLWNVMKYKLYININIYVYCIYV